MKRKNIIVFSKYQLLSKLLIISCIFFTTGCVNDHLDSCMPNKQLINIGFSVPHPKRVQTRSWLNEADENIIANMYLMIFDNGGNRIHFDGWDQIIEANQELLNQKIVKKGVLLTANVAYTFVLYANIDSEQYIMNGPKLNELNSIQKFEELDKIRCSLTQPFSISRINKNLAMYGIKHETVKSNPTKKIEIPLLHIDAKIKFIIKTANADISFTPDTWSIYNLPKSVSLNPSEKNTDLSGAENYFNSLDNSFSAEGAFTEFYMLPNTKESKKNISGGSASEMYRLREKQEKIPTDKPFRNTGGTYVENGPYIYADQYATYIEIKGRFRKQEDGKQVSANTRYIVHLGYIENNPNNWEADSNSQYTYTLTVNDVNDIKIEVTDDNENHPGAEGDIVKEANHIIDVDALYETGGIILTKEEIRRAKAYFREINYDYTQCFMCNTPFDKGGTKDYSWVEFIQNPTNYTKLVSYNGNNRKLNVIQMLDAINSYNEYSNQPLIFSVFIHDNYYDTKPNWISYNGDWEADGWRLFVNQPDRTLSINLGNSVNLISRDQKSSYHQPDILIRQKSILTPYSTDPNIFPYGKVAIGMGSIQDPPSYSWANSAKVANLNIYGWSFNDNWAGAKNDFEFYKSFNKKMQFSLFRMVLEKSFKYTLFIDKNSSINNFSPQFQCLRWNLSNETDDKITESNLKWYTPAIDEILLMGGLGNSSIPADSRLFQGPLPINKFVHFVSSTAPGNYYYNKFAYFAEQQSSYSEQIYSGEVRESGQWGSQSTTYDYVTSPNGYGKGGTGTLHYRCVRRLGKVSNLTPADRPYNLASSSPYKIDIQLEQKSVRNETLFLYSGELPKHDQLSEYNKPYRSFFVAKECISRPKDNKPKDYEYTFDEAQNACAEYREDAGGSSFGWRLPNASELSIMYQVMGDEKSGPELEKANKGWINLPGAEYTLNDNYNTFSKVYWSSTLFSNKNANWDRQYVYAMNKGIHKPIIGLARVGNVKGYVRCVKDAK